MSTLTDLRPTTVHYSVTADAHPGALPCVLELFALRNITPDLVKVSKYRQAACPTENITIDIHISGLNTAEQEVILRKLESQVSVQYVREEVLYQKTPVKLAS